MFIIEQRALLRDVNNRPWNLGKFSCDDITDTTTLQYLGMHA